MELDVVVARFAKYHESVRQQCFQNAPLTITEITFLARVFDRNLHSNDIHSRIQLLGRRSYGWIHVYIHANVIKNVWHQLRTLFSNK